MGSMGPPPLCFSLQGRSPRQLFPPSGTSRERPPWFSARRPRPAGAGRGSRQTRRAGWRQEGAAAAPHMGFGVRKAPVPRCLCPSLRRPCLKFHLESRWCLGNFRNSIASLTAARG